MTTTDLVATTPGASSSFDLAPAAWSLAQKLANTDFVPSALRNKPEAVLAAMLTGNELGIPPMQSLSKIHVIDGRPAMAAELMRAVIQRQGHEIFFDEMTTTKVTIGGRRAGSTRETRVTWTMDDAEKAGLAGKQNWRRYPRAMLIARATGELGRLMFADCLAGISYTLEELTDGDVIDLEDLRAGGGADEGAAPPGRRRRAPRGAITPAGTAPTAAADPPAEPEPAAGAPEPPALPEDEPVKPELVDETPAPLTDSVDLGDDWPEGEGPDEHHGAAGLAWHQMAAIKSEEAGLDDASRHGLYTALTGGRTERGAELGVEEQPQAIAAFVKIKRGDAALALAVDELAEVWVLVAKDGTVTAGAPQDKAGTVFELDGSEAPGAPETADGSDPSPDGDEAGTAAPSAGEAAPVPGTEEDWRELMRARDLRLPALIRHAANLATELGHAPPGNLAALVADPDLGAALAQRLKETK